MLQASADSQVGTGWRRFLLTLQMHVAQVFNEFNARKIQDELNVFSGLWQSRTFLYIMVITVGFQVCTHIIVGAHLW